VEKCSAETATLLSSLLISLQNLEVTVKPVMKESHKCQKNIKIVKIVEPEIKYESSEVAGGEPICRRESGFRISLNLCRNNLKWLPMLINYLETIR